MKKLIFMLLLLPCWCWGQGITDTTGTYKLGNRMVTNTTLPSLWTNATGSEAYRVNKSGDTTWLYRWTNDTILKVIKGNGLTIPGIFHDSTSSYYKPGEWTDAAQATRGGMWLTDTVKVIMFVTDSAYLNEKLNVYGIFGYMATEETTWSYSAFFLDERKKRLPKNIIVWDYKEIKQ